MISAAITGFATGFSLILAIGSQNAFILRQGLAKRHVFPLVLFCAVSDALLIAAGVAGFSAIVSLWPLFPIIMTWGGAIFLTVYGLQRLWTAWRGKYDIAEGASVAGLGASLAMVAAFTWLNPHVYLDTLALIGAISTDFEYGWPRLAFGLGAVTASFVFFFGLGYGASLLSPIMQSAKAWRILDVIIGLVMLALAAKLIWG